jgi:hypothetical protein
MPQSTNTEAWGNIELPGLSDEELYKKNWTLIASSREVVKTREQNGWYEKNAKAHKDKDMKAIAPLISKTAVETRKQKGWKEKWLLTINERNNSEVYKTTTLEAIKRRTQSKDWQEKNKEARKQFLKPIVTPFGIFQSVKEALKELNRSEGWLMNQRKKFPNEYYLVSQEEYIMLTGKDI